MPHSIPLPDLNQMNAVEQTIHTRKTSKVLLPIELRHEQQAMWKEEHGETLEHILAAAAWAPFHKRVHEQHCTAHLNAPMPWRFHVVDSEACTRLLEFLESQAKELPDSKWSRAWQSKIKEMVSACGVLIQATWLPDPVEPDENHLDESAIQFSHKNIEHVAAASSAVQNLLLSAESHQWLSYWSSGGILRDEQMFDFMGISRQEKLLGSIFLSPAAHPSARIIDGGLRDKRGELSGWVRWV